MLTAFTIVSVLTIFAVSFEMTRASACLALVTFVVALRVM